MSQDIHALSGAYAVDALDSDEQEEFSHHLAGCAECREEAASLQEVGAELASLTQTAPPPSLRGSILREVSQVRPLPPPASLPHDPSHDVSGAARSAAPTSEAQGAVVADLGRHREQRSTYRRWLAAAAAALVLVAAGVTWHPWDPGTSQSQLTATEQVLQAGDAQRFVKHVDGATATIVRSVEKGKSVIIAEGMASPPNGKVYELWYFDAQGKAVRAGLLPQADKRVTMLLEGDAATATGVGLTVEPVGGSDQPTSKPIVAVTFA